MSLGARSSLAPSGSTLFSCLVESSWHWSSCCASGWRVRRQAGGAERWRTPTHRVSYSKPHPAKSSVSLPGPVVMCCLQLKSDSRKGGGEDSHGWGLGQSTKSACHTCSKLHLLPRYLPPGILGSPTSSSVNRCPKIVPGYRHLVRYTSSFLLPVSFHHWFWLLGYVLFLHVYFFLSFKWVQDTRKLWSRAVFYGQWDALTQKS